MQIKASQAPVGAEITDVDVSKPLDQETFNAIEKIFHERGVLVFRDQHLSEQQHIAFSRRFGNLEIHVAREYLKPGYPEILVVSNVVENGRNICLADDWQYWHSDLSYIANPSRCSLLYALEVPVKDGRVLGETLFASAAYAYDTLPEDLKRQLASRSAVHRYGDRYMKQQAGGKRAPLSQEQLEEVPDVLHPVIRAHPITGRKVIFVNEGFTTRIEGLSPEDSDSLLQKLFTHITRPETLYAHQWREGDLLMWDNCLTQHRAIRDYEWPLRRRMHRTTVAGFENRSA